MDYLKFAAQDKYVASVATATTNIPATDAAAARSRATSRVGRTRSSATYAKKFAVLRPVTPGYPFIATEFTKTAQDILNGADPQEVPRSGHQEHRRQPGIQQLLRVSPWRAARWGSATTGSSPRAWSSCSRLRGEHWHCELLPPSRPTRPQTDAGRSHAATAKATSPWTSPATVALLMLLPAGVLMITFLIIPIMLTFVLAFTNARLISPEPAHVRRRRQLRPALLTTTPSGRRCATPSSSPS